MRRAHPSGPPRIRKRERLLSADSADVDSNPDPKCGEIDHEIEEELRQCRVVAANYYAKLQAEKTRGSRWLLGNIQLDDYMLESLSPQKWLVDTIISGWTELEMRSSPGLGTISSPAMSQLDRPGPGPAKISILRNIFQDLSNVKKIVVPVNTNNCHWTLLVIDVLNHELIYLDSMREAPTARGHSLMSNMGDLLNQTYGGDPWLSRQASGHARQNNGVDCGVFVCYFIKTIAKLVREKYHGQLQDDAFSSPFNVESFRSDINSRIRDAVIPYPM